MTDLPAGRLARGRVGDYTASGTYGGFLMAQVSYELIMEIIAVAEAYAKSEKKRLKRLGEEQARARKLAEAEPKTER